MHNFGIKMKQKGSVAVSKKGLFFIFLKQNHLQKSGATGAAGTIQGIVYLINIALSFAQRENVNG